MQVPSGHGRWGKHFSEMHAECERIASPRTIGLASEGQKLFLNNVLPLHWEGLAGLLRPCTRSTSLNAATLNVPLYLSHMAPAHLGTQISPPWLLRNEGMGCGRCLWYIYASVRARACLCVSMYLLQNGRKWGWCHFGCCPSLSNSGIFSRLFTPKACCLLSASSTHVCLSPLRRARWDMSHLQRAEWILSDVWYHVFTAIFILLQVTDSDWGLWVVP